MAGIETNDDILAGLNQVIVALNDQQHYRTSVVVAGTGGCGGVDPPSEGGVEGGDPPVGWEETDDPPGDPDYEDRKCSMANALHDTFYSYIEQWAVYDVDSYAGGLTIALITLLGAIAGELVLPIIGLVIGSVVAFVAGLALVIVGGGFDLGDMLTIMSANKDDLVCALYNSEDADDAIERYIDVLETGGASGGDVLLFRALVISDFLNYLFFKRDPAVEATMGGYSGAVDCSSTCGECPFWEVGYGTGTPRWDGEEFILTSEWNSSTSTWHIDLRLDASCSCEDSPIHIGDLVGGYGGYAGGLIGECDSGRPWEYAHGYEAVKDRDYCAKIISFHGTGSFTAEISVEPGAECP